MQENMISSTNNLHGKQIKESLGMVFGTTIRTRGIFGNILVWLESIKGGKVKSYLSELEKARIEATKDMVRNAEKLRADGIVGVDFDMSEVLNNKMMVSVNGTAVKFVEE
jgi:uncharacterized protein YbjQ (UPF0145 family)